MGDLIITSYIHDSNGAASALGWHLGQVQFAAMRLNVVHLLVLTVLGVLSELVTGSHVIKDKGASSQMHSCYVDAFLKLILANRRGAPYHAHIARSNRKGS